MIIGGLQRSSLIDYPERISAVIFTQGCNFRCPYCYNPELVDPDRYTEPIREAVIFEFLATRQGKLDGVVVTGGEPTVQSDLFSFIKRVKEMGFLVKIDTNGSRPDIVSKGIEGELFDYIALDVKAPLNKYRIVTNTDVKLDNIKKSIRIVMDSGIDYEFRTTVIKDLLTEEDLCGIGRMIEGAKAWTLQRFVSKKVLNRDFENKSSFSVKELSILQHKLSRFVGDFCIR